jgi:hypothetical protein
VDEPDVGRRPHEGQRDEVHPEAYCELEVGDVLVRQGRHRDAHAWKRESLVVGDCTADRDLEDDVGTLDVEDL